jgi:predicted amidophosphoribosyltransferase
MCNFSLQWRPEDFNSYKWVQAMKGNPLNGYAWVPVNGVQRRLTNANLADAIDWFGVIAANHLSNRDIEGPFLAVPVPNSGCIVGSSVKPQTRKLAKAVCDTLKDGSYVLDCIRYKKNLGSASKQGGPRDAGIIYHNAVILEDQLKGVDRNLSVLLVDDVTTSGGHLRACVAKLHSKRLNTKYVVCGGKTIYDQANPAFHVYEYTLENYQP